MSPTLWLAVAALALAAVAAALLIGGATVAGGAVLATSGVLGTSAFFSAVGASEERDRRRHPRG